MVLIDRKFNKEQLLLDTFSPKMHIERDIRKKLIFKFVLGVKTSVKKSSMWGSGCFNMLFRISISNIFDTQTFVGSFSKFTSHFDLICLDNSLNTLF